jgi:hypothetical protein
VKLGVEELEKVGAVISGLKFNRDAL